MIALPTTGTAAAVLDFFENKGHSIGDRIKVTLGHPNLMNGSPVFSYIWSAFYLKVTQGDLNNGLKYIHCLLGDFTEIRVTDG